MSDYRKLAIRYLKMNKKRSVITIIGVIVTVTILYTMLNLGWSALLTQRKTLRQEQDYEIVFMTENQGQIEQIMADSRVKSASIATYYDYGYDRSTLYENALYINTTNPYRLDKTQKELVEEYGVKSELNEALAWTYLQGGEGNMTEIMILTSILVSFIFAIFGVGIVRNSIQLCTLEQIKDYGNMRCIGATKGQLKAIIYMEGAILELTGNAIGIALGFIISYVIGSILKWEVGLHVIPMIPVLIAFLGDLYFAMEENCKVVTNMTPVSAIRGEFRIRKEKIKVRKKSIYGKLFGVEGDYAYKSIMRNPGRFYKTVWSLGLALASFIAVSGCVNSITTLIEEQEEAHKYYQVYFENVREPYERDENIKSSLPPAEVLRNISDLEEVTEAKRLYASKLVLADWESFYEMYTDEYLNMTLNGDLRERNKDSYMEKDIPIITDMFTSISCYGYDEKDYKRYEELLVEGKLDVSEKGILVVNGGKVEKYDEDSLEFQAVEMIDVAYMNYKVGDTIDFVDSKLLWEKMEQELILLEEQYQKEKSELPEPDVENYMGETEADQLENEYLKKKREVYIKIRQQLIDEGKCETYTIEGILRDDANHYNYCEPRIIVPLEHYYTITGTDESMLSGMQYRFETFSYNKYEQAMGIESNFFDVGYYDISYDCSISLYPGFMLMFESFKKPIIGVGIAILFVVLMNTLNIINTTASNLHLRKKEFAQLRVIGISKNRLMKMVLLEGVISSLAANLIGIILGAMLSYGFFSLFFGILYNMQYQFPLAAVIIGVFVSTLILCGSVYMPLKELRQDIAEDLALGGE